MLIEKIRQDMITARKLRNSIKKSLLVTLYAETLRVGKDKRNGDTTDEEVIATVKKFKANAEETIALLEAKNQDSSVQQQEVAILDRYLPAQMSREDLTVAAKSIAESLAEKGPKAMGAVMAELKKQYAGRYDGKMASDVVKTVLAGE